MIMAETEPRNCPWHSGFKSDIDHLSSSDRDQWDAISGLRNKLDRQTWLLVATLAGIITQLVLATLRCFPFILLLLLPFQAQAIEREEIYGLTKAEWKGELAFQVLNVADMALTDRILDQGGHEMNPVLSIDSNSSDLEIGLVTVGIGVLHYLVTRYVVAPEWRSTWQWVSGGAKLVAVGHNFTIVEW